MIIFAGDNVTLEGAYIWDDVTIEDNSTVNTAVIADRAHIKSGVTINPGSVIGAKVTIATDDKFMASIATCTVFVLYK